MTQHIDAVETQNNKDILPEHKRIALPFDKTESSDVPNNVNNQLQSQETLEALRVSVNE